MYKWKRTHPQGYQVSSKGDKRFSAFYATLKDGRTIEQAYQLDVKGFRSMGYTKSDLLKKDDHGDYLIKGRSPLKNITREKLYNEYLLLWIKWAGQNPQMVQRLRRKVKNYILTDMFATSQINQARAWADILNEIYKNQEE